MQNNIWGKKAEECSHLLSLCYVRVILKRRHSDLNETNLIEIIQNVEKKQIQVWNQKSDSTI